MPCTPPDYQNIGGCPTSSPSFNEQRVFWALHSDFEAARNATVPTLTVADNTVTLLPDTADLFRELTFAKMFVPDVQNGNAIGTDGADKATAGCTLQILENTKEADLQVEKLTRAKIVIMYEVTGLSPTEKVDSFKVIGVSNGLRVPADGKTNNSDTGMMWNLRFESNTDKNEYDLYSRYTVAVGADYAANLAAVDACVYPAV